MRGPAALSRREEVFVVLAWRVSSFKYWVVSVKDRGWQKCFANYTNLSGLLLGSAN